MNGYYSGDLTTPEAVHEWFHVFRNRARRRFREQQERTDWGEFSRGSYRASVAYWSRLRYRSGRVIRQA